MTFAILGRTALFATRRQATAAAASQQAKRRMGSAAAPEWTGIDKVVRGYFPKDEQLVVAISGGYFGLFLLYKIKSAISGSPEEVAAPVVVAAPASSSGDIPDVDSEEFGAFLESEENVMKFVASIEK
mmetsp:Transcript_22178/g.39531  ORF Transcript_22178/g.39531 Transcript_22178/m.39531 type:complete len:128 (+) Transcript_22178:117-500(+)|eukprot:CAMPEP_0201608818 /NCGR_PEP_ID=MMETSP0492-20130828/9078_1 /ASSEMBLY_ACC=CAM_ASM_000837 /TAXON_ID=420259 /ORGANISM="Thalassiosira gravida, Strain GMp14c1" /LENGTH=127 /DNA_ID=CAMNT_0048073811 /DNA_START=52 /DNA_END=435 /DNA_ORIENTATION=-